MLQSRIRIGVTPGARNCYYSHGLLTTIFVDFIRFEINDGEGFPSLVINSIAECRMESVGVDGV